MCVCVYNPRPSEQFWVTVSGYNRHTVKVRLITFMWKILIRVSVRKVRRHVSPKFGYHQNLQRNTANWRFEIQNKYLKQDQILFSHKLMLNK